MNKVLYFLFIAFVCWLSLVVPIASWAQEDQAQKLANKALEDIKRSINLSQERSQQLRDEVSRLQQDQDSLIQILITSVGKERNLGEAVREREEKLQSLLVQRIELEHALELRRKEFGDVLVMLERMGLRPPPAILVEASDALQSVRSSMLLGSIVLQLRERTQALTNSLDELVRLEQSLNNEQDELTQAIKAQQEERQRLELLLAEKSRLQQKSEQNLEEVEAENKRLEQKAQSLSELVQELGKQKSHRRILPQATDDRDDLLTLKSNFSQLRGSLVLPVMGNQVQFFDANFPGELYETAPGAVIMTPTEGLVRYAGAFRSYGQMLILDVGQDYHLVLAGMGRLDVKAGQILLAGEPIGMMSSKELHTQGASTTSDEIDTTVKPSLYVELRKDGLSINPAPWWKK